MTGTLTDTHPRTTRRERLFVLGGLMLAALFSGASLASGAGTEVLAPVWLSALVWTVLASLAGALRRGLRHRDWSALRTGDLPDGRAERFDWDTRTGSYAWMRDLEDRHLHDDDHLR